MPESQICVIVRVLTSTNKQLRMCFLPTNFQVAKENYFLQLDFLSTQNKSQVTNFFKGIVIVAIESHLFSLDLSSRTIYIL